MVLWLDFFVDFLPQLINFTTPKLDRQNSIFRNKCIIRNNKGVLIHYFWLRHVHLLHLLLQLFLFLTYTLRGQKTAYASLSLFCFFLNNKYVYIITYIFAFH